MRIALLLFVCLVFIYASFSVGYGKEMINEIQGISEEESYTWWNEPFNFCLNITLTDPLNGAELDRVNEPVEIYLDFNKWEHAPYNNSLRIINMPCRQGGYEVPSQIIESEYSGSYYSNVSLIFLANKTENITSVWSVYWTDNDVGKADYFTDLEQNGNCLDTDCFVENDKIKIGLDYDSGIIKDLYYKPYSTSTDLLKWDFVDTDGHLGIMYSDNSGYVFYKTRTDATCSLTKNGTVLVEINCTKNNGSAFNTYRLYNSGTLLDVTSGNTGDGNWGSSLAFYCGGCSGASSFFYSYSNSTNAFLNGPGSGPGTLGMFNKTRVSVYKEETKINETWLVGITYSSRIQHLIGINQNGGQPSFGSTWYNWATRTLNDGVSYDWRIEFTEEFSPAVIGQEGVNVFDRHNNPIIVTFGEEESINVPPVLEPIGNQIINENEVLAIYLNASDHEMDNLTYTIIEELPSPFYFNETTGLFIWSTSSSDVGEHFVTFGVTDGNNTDSETITIKVNGRPVINSSGEIIAYESQRLLLYVNATDPNNDNLMFGTNADDILPSTFSFNETSGLLNWTPTLNDSGNYYVLFNVTDGLLSDEKTFNITVLNTNQPPILFPVGNKSLNITETITIQLQASDPDNDNLIFGTNADDILPSTFSFNENGGLFEWTPEEEDGGYYVINFNVTDGFLVDSEIIFINVNGPPVLNSIGNRVVNESQMLILQLGATDPNNDVLIFGTSAESVIPSEFYFNETSGLFVWVPEYMDSGAYSVRFTVTDGMFTDEEIITIFVIDVNLPPTIDFPGNQTTDENETLSIQLTASDPDNNTLIFGTDSTLGNLNENTGLFTWTPTFFDDGLYVILFNVTDGSLNDNIIMNITVADIPGPPVLYPIEDIIVVETDVVIIQPEAIDPDNDTISYSINDNRFTKLGSNIFIWDTHLGDTGVYSFSVTASDGQFNDTKPVNVIVLEPGVCGDLDNSGFIDSIDLSMIIDYIFFGADPPEHEWVVDVNGDGIHNVLDIVALIDHLFRGGDPPTCGR